MLPDFFAQSHTPYLHARGKRGTEVLLAELAPCAGQRILEIGFGTGQTLVDIVSRCPGLTLYGLEKSPLMLKAARQRLRFCGLQPINLELYQDAVPFDDHFFDAVYCESVLAIAPDTALRGIFKEIYRVLKPGGRFCCNETLWLKTTAPETILAFNRKCLDLFGIVQASALYPYPEDWQTLGASTGLLPQKVQSLQKISVVENRPFNRARLLSALYSRLGWLKGQLNPKINRNRRAWKAKERLFNDHDRLMEGYLLVFQKPELL